MFKRFQKMSIPQRDVVTEPVAPELFDVAINDAMWEEETKYQEKPKRAYRKRNRKGGAREAVVAYLVERHGLPTRTLQIANRVHVQHNYVPRLINELVASKTIRVDGKGFKRRYHVLRGKGTVTSDGQNRTHGGVKGGMYSPKYGETLKYISAHEGNKITLQEIADSVGVTNGQVCRYVQRLLDKGSIVRRPVVEGKPKFGFVYWTKGSVELQAQPAKMVESNNEPQFVAVLEGLMWEYLKDTNRFNDGAVIHTFIEWLKTKGE